MEILHSFVEIYYRYHDNIRLLSKIILTKNANVKFIFELSFDV